MRLLLTGAAGFTGQHFIKSAQAAGYEVFGLKADLTDAEALATEVLTVAPTHVVHLAAISAVTHSDEEAFYRVNLFGTLNLLKALVALPIAPLKILLASTANVYGNYEGDQIAETVCPKPVNHYAMSKLAMEHMAATYFDQLPIVIVRPFNYTGVGHDQRFVIPKIVDGFTRCLSSIELGNLEVFREYNDVRMVCDMYIALLKNGRPKETYNVCSGEIFALRDVINRVQILTNHPIAVNVNPKFVRSNEVHRLGGDPSKLRSVIGDVKIYSLDETLMWMLENG